MPALARLDDAPAKLADTGKLALTWIKSELSNFLESAMDELSEFVNWVKIHWDIFKQQAAAVAKVLREFFKQFTNEAIRVILAGIGYAAEVIEEAIALLEEACSMTRAALSL